MDAEPKKSGSISIIKVNTNTTGALDILDYLSETYCFSLVFDDDWNINDGYMLLNAFPLQHENGNGDKKEFNQIS